MRSALNVLSLSTSAPQMTMIPSASLAAAAATQGAGAICGFVTGSALVANTWCGGVAHRTEATATLRIRAEKQSRIDLSCGSLFRYWNERSKWCAVRTTADFRTIIPWDFNARLAGSIDLDRPARISGLTTFEWLIGLLLGAVLLSALARRIKVPYPTFLAIGGMLLAFVPSGPSWTLEPDLALALFVAPVLLDGAFDTSARALRDNWLPVSTLVFVAVGLTTTAVAVLVRWLLPDMPWAAAIALGAIVAPPDAAAATAILRQVNLPYRILKILEGERLLNDASALLIYRVAAGAAAVQHFKWSEFAPSIVLALAGSLVAGYLFARTSMLLTRRITDAPSSIIVQFAGTFTVWIVAEHIGLSGILPTVAYAITIARPAPARTPARLRVPSYAVWETAVFVLNVLAFMLIGMQLRPIWERLDDVGLLA